MKKFGLGLVTGVLGTIASAAMAGFAYHKQVIEPIEDEEAKFEETELKAARKAAHSHGPRF
ncbi:DUF3042 family protein [Weissella halotolerans]|uniref:DUF3042 domain-containing protein n=1 Tax=Weissella halotolerans DSM 20190 TaxID=1123500 RepID=A0A0R2FWT0_9LACO|nr:DUF3042 family protein [Weissella halotolerans]KRN32462.1 hypothetical protein IV68_GL000816 [Weissella halotolerans DSM 20190]